MKTKALLLAATLVGTLAGTQSLIYQTPAQAQAAAPGKRALLIGINKYREPVDSSSAVVHPKKDGINDLKGCVNDVETIRDMLVAKYGFRAEDILLLEDKAATKANILNAIQTHLIAKAQPGDTTVFYYSGHGSQVRNSASDERDKLDEGIVPVDVMKIRQLIRDKELAPLFNQVLDKGAHLTAFFDSCFSGSVARGLAQPVSLRVAPTLTRDLALRDVPMESPEERGALIFSASQDFQPSADWHDDAGRPYGAFTNALLVAMRNAPAYETAERLFLRTKAVMAASGLPMPQEPVLAGRSDVRTQPLFGLSARAAATEERTVALVGLDSRGRLVLQGGVAQGLQEGAELRAADSATPVRLRVTKVPSAARVLAEVIEGSTAALKPGDLFVIEKDAVANDARLSIWLPPTSLKEAELKAVAAELGKGKPLGGAWVADPTATTPTHVVSWDGAWKLRTNTGAEKPLGAKLTVAGLNAVLKGLGAKAPQVYVQFPPSAELAAQLRDWSAQPGHTVAFTPTRDGSQYWLVGRKAGKDLQYAFAMPNRTEADAGEPLPLRSDWVTAQADQTARQLAVFATRAARVKSWLKLEAPAPDSAFPFHLALKNAETGAIVKDGKLVGDQSYGLVLQQDKAMAGAKLQRRYVYVFSIDGNGNTRLLFPRRSHGNVENNFPGGSLSAPETTVPDEIPLGPSKLFQVKAPYGTETYVALATEEAIPHPEVLEADGIRTRGQAGSMPLERLVSDLGNGTRGSSSYKIQHNWSLERLVLRSEAQK